VTAEFDAYLDQILIGGREAIEIVICEHDPSWQERFGSEQRRLASALSDQAMVIEHIGSTAVPGLAAKPIIDILVTVAAIEPDEPYRSKLEAANYVLRVREPDHRMFRSPDRDVHIHVWPAGHQHVDRYLIFRDWLRHNAADRALYELHKRQLAQRQWSDMNHYAEAKSEAIVPILQRASWAATQRLEPWASSSE
jgi:GrpB-like predicted nucleotidyltransferase (UPF0157 family)